MSKFQTADFWWPLYQLSHNHCPSHARSSYCSLISIKKAQVEKSGERTIYSSISDQKREIRTTDRPMGSDLDILHSTIRHFEAYFGFSLRWLTLNRLLNKYLSTQGSNVTNIICKNNVRTYLCCDSMVETENINLRVSINVRSGYFLGIVWKIWATFYSNIWSRCFGNVELASALVVCSNPDQLNRGSAI